MTDPVRILVADDHPIYRDGLAMLLNSMAGLDVVGLASDGEEAVQLAASLDPDVIVMDVTMPKLNGVEATRSIVAGNPSIGVVVVTMSEDDETLFEAMRAGARGYLLKGAGQADIVRAIHSVAGGDVVFGPNMAGRIAAHFAGLGPLQQRAPGAFPQLTEREREVLGLIAAGRTNAQIGEALFISPKTARNTVSNIYSKLQVVSRAEAIILARDAGLG